MPNLKHPSPRSSGKVLRSRWRRWIGLGAVLPFLVQLVGCGEDAAALPIACSGDNYCPPARSSAWWAIQLWPTETGDKVGADPHWLLTPQEGQSLSFDGTGSAQLRFRAAALLSGLVQTADNRALVRARVQATLPSAIPGQNDYRFDTQTAEKVAGTYSLRIPTPAQPDDQLYRFWVGFDDASQASMYPPMWLEHPVTGDLELPIQLRPATQLAVLSGRITNPLGEGVGGLREPLVAVVAHAVARGQKARVKRRVGRDRERHRGVGAGKPCATGGQSVDVRRGRGGVAPGADVVGPGGV